MYHSYVSKIHSQTISFNSFFKNNKILLLFFNRFNCSYQIISSWHQGKVHKHLQYDAVFDITKRTDIIANHLVEYETLFSNYHWKELCWLRIFLHWPQKFEVAYNAMTWEKTRIKVMANNKNRDFYKNQWLFPINFPIYCNNSQKNNKFSVK